MSKIARKTQYPRADDLGLSARLKLVAKLHGMGLSEFRIANELDYSRARAKRDIAAVVDRYREFEDLDTFLKDVTARTGDQITRLETNRAILAKQLDYASEWVPSWVYLQDGSRVPELDEEGKPAYGPRKGGVIVQLVGQIQSIDKQIAELLGLMSTHVDVSVTLHKTETTQLIILEAIKEVDPEIYAQIRQRIRAKTAAQEKPALPSGSSSAQPLQDAIDVDYLEMA